MFTTQDVKDTIQARAQRDPAFRKALLQEGVECLLAGDIDTGNDSYTIECLLAGDIDTGNDSYTIEWE